MSHQFVQGFFSNNEPAWHNLGHVFPADVWPGTEEARRIAGHDKKIIEEPVYAKGRELTDFKALFQDDGVPLSIVSRGYEVIQDEVPYQLIEAVANAGAKWHCGMTLEGGQRVVVGLLPEAWTAPGDDSPTLPFIVATWAHDGKVALRLMRVATRVVCANTKAMAEREADASGLQISIRHTKNWKDYVEPAKQALMGLRKAFEEYKELATELAGISVSNAQVETFLNQFLPMPDTVEIQYSKIVERNVNQARANVRAILGGANGTTAEAHHRTAYGLWQSGLEYLQHTRKSRTAYSKLNRSILREERVAQNLHKLVLQVCNG